ncbi:MAG: hemolysin family protein, partial [Chloroflexota bacterium]
ENEEEIITNIFDFRDRQVHQVMTPRPKVEAVPYNIPLDDLFKLVSESKHSRFPVYEDDLDNIIGVLHLKDLIRHLLKQRDQFDIRLLLRPIPVIPEHYPAEELLIRFKHQRVHLAVVLDEFGGTAGIVTLEDLVEEVVGEVRDEFDQEYDPLIRHESGVLEVAGDYLVADLAELVDLGEEARLPQVETIGGLVMAGLGRVPEAGDQLVYNETVQLIVLAVDGRAVERVRVEYSDKVEHTSDD